MDFDLTIKSFNQKLKNKEFSLKEFIQEFFNFIKKEDEKIKAYISYNEDVIKEAEALEKIFFEKGGEIPILFGLPIAIKDNILIKDKITTAGSKMLLNYKASYDASVIKKLKNENVLFLGKTNLDEFAMGSSTENSAFFTTNNPFDLERVPGGSSGGSAAAVASNLALAALGSDTGGSIRQPAAFCGVVGLKPTYGAVSRFGLIAMASSLDQIGPITKTVEDAELLFEKIAGKDDFDSTTLKKPELNNLSFNEIKKMKIGLPKEIFEFDLEKEVEKEINFVLEKLKTMDIELIEVSLPYIKNALSVYYIIMPAEVSTNLARFDGLRYGGDNFEINNNLNLKEIYFKNRTELFGEEVKRRIILGTFVLSSGYYDAYYNKAQKVRFLIKQNFQEVFKKVDLVFIPTSPTLPFKKGEKVNDPLSMYLSDIFTIPVNLAGLPAISLPTRKFDKHKKELPVGFQLIADYFQENKILNLGKYYENF